MGIMLYAYNDFCKKILTLSAKLSIAQLSKTRHSSLVGPRILSIQESERAWRQVKRGSVHVAYITTRVNSPNLPFIDFFEASIQVFDIMT